MLRTRQTIARAMLLTLAGCGGQDGDDDGASTSVAAATTVTMPTTGDATETDGGASGPTTGGSDPTSGGEAGPTTGEFDGPYACGVPAEDYGDCGTELGWAFDGEFCTRRLGCDCGADCAMFFNSDTHCARVCSEAGECNPERVHAYGVAEDPVGEGDSCDRLVDCDVSLEEAGIIEHFFYVEYAEMELPPCESGGMGVLVWSSDELDPGTWQDVCAITLVEAVEALWCVLDPCIYADDGMCDEPDFCPEGSDTSDCP